ncbi:arginine-glutamic acid dipeptide repeats protein [Ptiloglossa arizonensis]|uniref:arginine-glutamic acid dipeptide repeats protein n=1 Tax=Ptiloglossa arizonensis TaxID=3350558 RepID=UPI003FA04F7A
MGIHETEQRDRFNCAMDCKTEVTDKGYSKGVAEIPEYRERINLDVDYRDFPEEKIWSPRDEVNKWVPLYIFMARSVLTFVQEKHGIPNREAMENSCTGYAEQYISDVLHDSEYVPEVALMTLLTKEMPQKLIARWTNADIDFFIQGIGKHGKNFLNIQKDFLPQKDPKDIVDFYYTWKWSESAKRLRNCRRRRRARTKRHFPSIRCIFGELSSSKVVTRSVTAASKSTSLKKSKEIQSLEFTRCTRSSTSVKKRKRNSSRVTR